MFDFGTFLVYHPNDGLVLACPNFLRGENLCILKLTCFFTDGNCFKVDTLETYARHVDTLRKTGTLTPGKHITCFVFK